MAESWREYYRSLSDDELDDLDSEEYTELMNHVMQDEDEELAEEEAELGLPRGFWTPAEAEKYIDESQGFLDARWCKVDEIRARQRAEMEAMEVELEALRERERKLKWKPFV